MGTVDTIYKKEMLVLRFRTTSLRSPWTPEGNLLCPRLSYLVKGNEVRSLKVLGFLTLWKSRWQSLTFSAIGTGAQPASSPWCCPTPSYSIWDLPNYTVSSHSKPRLFFTLSIPSWTFHTVGSHSESDWEEKVRPIQRFNIPEHRPEKPRKIAFILFEADIARGWIVYGVAMLHCTGVIWPSEALPSHR